jgi:hypothetical protein
MSRAHYSTLLYSFPTLDGPALEKVPLQPPTHTQGITVYLKERGGELLGGSGGMILLFICSTLDIPCDS